MLQGDNDDIFLWFQSTIRIVKFLNAWCLQVKVHKLSQDKSETDRKTKPQEVLSWVIVRTIPIYFPNNFLFCIWNTMMKKWKCFFEEHHSNITRLPCNIFVLFYICFSFLEQTLIIQYTWFILTPSNVLSTKSIEGKSFKKFVRDFFDFFDILIFFDFLQIFWIFLEIFLIYLIFQKVYVIFSSDLPLEKHSQHSLHF